MREVSMTRSFIVIPAKRSACRDLFNQNCQPGKQVPEFRCAASGTERDASILLVYSITSSNSENPKSLPLILRPMAWVPP